MVVLFGANGTVGHAIIGELGDNYEISSYSSMNYDLRDPLNAMKFKEYTPIHHFIYNSAIGYDDLITNLSYQKLLDMINVNLVSLMILTQSVIKNMITHDVKGSLTFISSFAAQNGVKGLSMYGATKGGIEAFMRGIAVEWGRLGIRANCVSPGYMPSKMTEKLDFGRAVKNSPLHEPTKPEDVARAVRFCMESNITGKVISV